MIWSLRQTSLHKGLSTTAIMLNGRMLRSTLTALRQLAEAALVQFSAECGHIWTYKPIFSLYPPSGMLDLTCADSQIRIIFVNGLRKNNSWRRSMRDYREAYNSFSVAELERETLSGSLSSGVNACVECCDRWAVGDRIALHWVSKDLTRHDITFARVQRDSARFANLLRSRGIGPGDVVAGLLPKVPELLTAILGTWRTGAIYQALFTAFGPD